ncbi:hypothetical protein AURDEDRAFT_185616 [Auricularia subglabra TFB-10046 SS5]|nr:hypothetical protein AURDEDRAFT_185616 [Auricularia subglabra TFB-10046 SS5]
MFNDAYTSLFGASELEMDALAKCNQFGRFPILPLSTTLQPAVHDGSLSDESCSPITPLDAYNLNLHTLCYQRAEPFAAQLEQCLPMSALYVPPMLHPSDVDSSSATDSSSPVSEAALLPISPPIVPSQAPPASKKRAAPSDDAVSDAAAPTAAKKPRVSLGRIRAKDFVPPDVSGLTKREARLVKNRAAAFLSRQRKREEFEAMEVRLTELERENEQLRRTPSSSSETAASPSPSSHSSSGDALEPMQLQLSSMRQLLQAAEEREQALKAELEELRLEPADAGDAPKTGSLGLMAVLSLSSVIKSAEGSSSWARELALCDAQSGVPEIEVSCSPCTDGRLRVRLHRPTEQQAQAQEDASDWSFDSPSSLGFMDDSFSSIFPGPRAQKRVRLALAGAKLSDDGAELEVEIR